MLQRIKYTSLFLALFAATQFVFAQQKATTFSSLAEDFKHPPQSAKPWTFWYWINGNVSKQGITADLEAMKETGLGGAYLMFIKDTVNPSIYKPAVSQLSKDWFTMVSFAIQEAKRLKLELGFHVSDGFALAGGPWITPALSMQKVVWSKLNINGGKTFTDTLPQPLFNEGYYKDIAVFAYPTLANTSSSTQKIIPVVTTSNGIKADFLLKANTKESFKTDSTAWVQYAFAQPFTCRTIIIRTNGNNYQSQRFIVQSSKDGINFKTITRLEPPCHGWQDTDADVTHSIPATTAKYFRFVYDKQGTEPGSEDLDNAKWKPTLKVSGIELSGEPSIYQYEGKNGEVWRISKRTTPEQIQGSLCVPFGKLINISSFFKNGKLVWNAPKGNWTIIRMGHTSTGHKNETAGGGKGLECDKFNPKAIELQFNSWFNKIYSSVDSATARDVIKLFHVDSWECGSQNWSPLFAVEFKKRRGYDLLPYLPVMAGVPVQSVAKSEQVLYDVRQTIAELVVDVFYTTLKKLSAEKNTLFSAESVAPTMLSDGMQHYAKVDLPMGEFWNNSPTHDKPNDMLDAITAAHVYGKNIVQAEAFTTVRMNWAEHPGSLKVLGDRNFALGINKMVLHVFSHNPFIHKAPGVTLDGVGLYYQRDQTWFKQGKAWIDYLSRCQSLLQQGQPVADIAVFTGEELPRRSVLPDRLVNTLPGIFGKEKLDAEKKRLNNEGQPMHQKPDGVSNAANNLEAADWVNSLNGYTYDAINPDALLRLAAVKVGRIVLPGGASYKLLVLPADMKMNPGNIMSNASAKKIVQLVKEGATVLMDSVYKNAFAANGAALNFKVNKEASIATLGKGKVMLTPYRLSSFRLFQLERDVEILNQDIAYSSIAYTHRKGNGMDVYFISNQRNTSQQLQLAFRITGKQPELWDAVTGKAEKVSDWQMRDSKTELTINLPANGSVFVVFTEATKETVGDGTVRNKAIPEHISLANKWKVQFDTAFGGLKDALVFDSLSDWSNYFDPRVKYYSGTAVYTNDFKLNRINNVTLQFTGMHDIATIKINGIDCGTLWTPPFTIDITHAVKKGNNTIEIAVTNTWRNRLIGDHALPLDKQLTFTTAPYRLEGKPLLPAGLTGEVKMLGY